MNELAEIYIRESVSIETLVKVCVSLNCEDDIVNSAKEKQPSFAEHIVSGSTVRNWEKLNTSFDGRLTTRANKRKSKKRVLPLEYISNKENILFLQNVLDYIDDHNIDIMSAIYTLGITLLKNAGIYERENVSATLSEYSNIDLDGGLGMLKLPNDEFDILGLIYQSYLQEGKKNITGSYYTPKKIACNMTEKFNLSNGELFFDPCCGSGSFLLSVPAKNPYQIYGVDNDEVAVLISKINMLLKFKDISFFPQIYWLDYLAEDSFTQENPIFRRKFDYIATNPPWGAMDNNTESAYCLTSKESFSCFFVKAFDQLKKTGTIRFLFPEAILNVKAHKDIRKFILETAGLVSVTTYDDMFSGVTTKYIDIECGKNADNEVFYVHTGNTEKIIHVETIYETENLVFNLLSGDDVSIIRLVKDKGKFSLQNSIWALGVVTGDNKGKLFSECLPGMERIYTGKEIQKYVLHPAKNYILYNRDDLQQVAREEIYRAPEKLVYKFISNKLVFAYDDSASLFLNSANILIPSIPSMSIKAVMAFLNSTLYQFLYIKLFGEVKILKGNLIELPFPEITEDDNNQLTALVDSVLCGDNSKIEAIENYIFSIYNLSEKQIIYVRSMVHGEID